MVKAKVLTHVSGSYCVVFLAPDFYIDARKSRQPSTRSDIEVVRSGQVIEYHNCVANGESPKLIIDLIRKYGTNARQ